MFLVALICHSNAHQRLTLAHYLRVIIFFPLFVFFLFSFHMIYSYSQWAVIEFHWIWLIFLFSSFRLSLPLCIALSPTLCRYSTKIRTVHGNQKSYVCNQCREGFSTNSALRIHVSRLHDERRLYGCLYCSFRFNSETALRKHVSATHLDYYSGSSSTTKP